MITYGYEINLVCDAHFCREIIRTNYKENTSFETIREFGEKRGWQVVEHARIYCPDHNGG
jgi:hypothetical protein